MSELCDSRSTDFRDEVANFVVKSSNVLVEILLSREQQVTQNTLIVLQLLVNSSHMTSQVTLRRQIVAQVTSETNPLVNRLNVSPKTASVRELGFTFQTRKLLLHMNRFEMILHTTSTCEYFITIFAFDSEFHDFK